MLGALHTGMLYARQYLGPVQDMMQDGSVVILCRGLLFPVLSMLQRG